jgi:hypothetical protein
MVVHISTYFSSKVYKKTPIILLEENVNHTTGKYVQNTLEQDNWSSSQKIVLNKDTKQN